MHDLHQAQILQLNKIQQKFEHQQAICSNFPSNATSGLAPTHYNSSSGDPSSAYMTKQSGLNTGHHLQISMEKVLKQAEIEREQSNSNDVAASPTMRPQNDEMEPPIQNRFRPPTGELLSKRSQLGQNQMNSAREELEA